MVKSELLNKYRIKTSDYEDTKLSWDSLVEIGDHFAALSKEFEQIGRDIADRFRTTLSEAHSVKYWVKNSEQLIAAIINKKIQTPKHNITLENYRTEVSDLIEVRILHLLREDWNNIHKFITQSWEAYGSPIAYYRDGDALSEVQNYKKLGCVPKEQEHGYRSVHYVIKTSPTRNVTLVEIQTRTLFEEAWSEIDHRVRHPSQKKETLISPFLMVFNRLAASAAASADEMASYVTSLQLALTKVETTQIIDRKKYEERLTVLEEKIKALQLHPKKQGDLEEQLKQLREHHQPFGSSQAFHELVVHAPEVSEVVETTVVATTPVTETAKATPATVEKTKGVAEPKSGILLEEAPKNNGVGATKAPVPVAYEKAVTLQSATKKAVLTANNATKKEDGSSTN